MGQGTYLLLSIFLTGYIHCGIATKKLPILSFVFSSLDHACFVVTQNASGIECDKNMSGSIHDNPV